MENLENRKPNAKNRKSFKYYSGILIVYTLVMVYLQCSLQNDYMNMLTPSLVEKYGWSRAQIAAPVSMGSLISIVSYFLISSIIIKTGNKKVVVACGLLAGLIILGIANMNSLRAYYVLQIIYQIILPVFAIAPFALMSNWFITGRGRILGIITIGGPLATASFTPVMTKTVQAAGFTSAFTSLGIIVVVISIVGLYAIKDKPEEVGYAPDNADMTVDEIEKNRKADEAYKSEWPISRIIMTKEFWLMVVGWGSIFLMMTSFMPNYMPRMNEVGIETNQALLYLSVGALAGMPFSYLWGWLDDKYSSPVANVIYAATMIFGSLMFIYVTPSTPVFSIGVVIFLASATGGMPNLQPSLVAYVYGRREFVNVSRYTFIAFGFFRSLAFVFMGLIFDNFGSYEPAYWLFIALTLISMLALSRVKRSYDPDRIAKNDDSIVND